MTGDLFVQQVRALPRSAFVAQHEYPFIVFGAVGGRSDEPGMFYTGTYRGVTRGATTPAPSEGAADVRRVDAATSARATIPPGFEPTRQTRQTVNMAATQALPSLNAILAGEGRFGGVFPVAKSERNPYAGRISIGRAATNDIVVPTLHVSKLHAHFIQGSPGGPWGVRDAQSTNGTFVNSRRCPPGELVSLRFGDSLLLGSLEARFVDAAGLIDMLGRR